MRDIINAIIVQEYFDNALNTENFINSVSEKTSGLIPKSEEEIKKALFKCLKNKDKNRINALDISSHLCDTFDILK